MTSSHVQVKKLPRACACPRDPRRPLPKHIRELYAALATAIDEEKTPMLARHWSWPTRQELRQMIDAEPLRLWGEAR